MFLPKTILGKWSAWLIVIFFLSVGLFYLLVISGYRGGDTFLSNPPLALTYILIAVSSISGFITGVVAIIKSKERSVVTFIFTFIGLLVTLFLLGDIFSSH